MNGFFRDLLILGGLAAAVYASYHHGRKDGVQAAKEYMYAQQMFIDDIMDDMSSEYAVSIPSGPGPTRNVVCDICAHTWKEPDRFQPVAICPNCNHSVFIY